jgi:hypothetical protein
MKSSIVKEMEKFISIGENIEGSLQGNLFGKSCFKINGKPFICFFQNEMVFKLNGTAHEKALALKGAQLFDPSGKKRPMKEWVQVPYTHQKKWSTLAHEAFNYVIQ